MTTTIRGTALVPGVSKNRRLYSREAIAKMVDRAQPKIRAGELTMRTHHGAEDDSTRVVGRVTKLSLGGDGSAQFEAELADTRHGRDMAALVKGRLPFVRGVSIRGAWKGPVKRVGVGDQTFETADDLDLDGLDFTPNPGVPGARIVAESAQAGKKARKAIFEEAPGPVVAVQDGPSAEDLAAMPLEQFDAAAAGFWGQRFADVDAQRHDGKSPFWRGLGGDAT